MGDEVLKEEFTALGRRRAGEIAIRHAAHYQRAMRRNFQPAVDVGKMFHHDHGSVAIGESHVGVKALAVVDHATEPHHAADLAANRDGGSKIVAARQKHRAGTGVHRFLDGGRGINLALRVGPKVIHVCPCLRIVPWDIGRLFHRQSQ